MTSIYYNDWSLFLNHSVTQLFSTYIIGRGNKKVMWPKRLKALLDCKCKKLMDSLKDEMERVDYVCTTADLWTGAKRGVYVQATA